MADSGNNISKISQKKPRVNDVTEWLTYEDEDSGMSYSVSAKWRELGIALGLTDNKLDEIEDETKGNASRLRKVLTHWIGNSKTCSWETLIGALQGGIVQKRSTADFVTKRLKEDAIYERYLNYDN